MALSGRSRFIVGYLVCIEIAFLVAYAHQFGLLSAKAHGIFPSLLFFDRFLAEYLLVSALLLIMINGNRLLCVSGWVLLAVFLAVNCIQLSSLARGGEFLSRLALENINHINILFNREFLVQLALLILLILLPPGVVRFARLPANSLAGIWPGVAFLVLTAIFFSQSHLWIPADVYRSRQELLLRCNVAHTSPFYALYKTLRTRKQEICLESFTSREMRQLREFGFSLLKDNPYPLVRPGHWRGRAFGGRGGDTPLPNLIVLFMEGISARSLACYGGRFQGITPNLQEFASQAMVVDNYYNHTAATYRGLHGQLCSLFPLYGGQGGLYRHAAPFLATNYCCLPDLLEKMGYETIFLDAHLEEKAFVDDMVRKLGFRQVYTAATLSSLFLAGARPELGDALSDSQLFASLVGLLQSRAAEKKNKPFFLGMYNFGTHAWVNPAENEARYGNGTNPTLNTVHNLDRSFGIFWQYFQTSPYAGNTVVIFTADHCHYPTQPYVATVDDPGYQRLFVDRIPLIIHDPRQDLPRHFDSRNSTSLDFAPSILHYLGIEVGATPFQGQSIFAKNSRQAGLGVAAIGNDIYLIEGSRIYTRKNTLQYRDLFALLEKYVRVTQRLEVGNQIWPGQ